ncbi:GA module-containing protein, partial [Staphylococcus aureus]|uniref:GA module-containing protein n=1 Tax=Staphylococcus aureus TaxID=1280 RepID=UPI001642C429
EKLNNGQKEAVSDEINGGDSVDEGNQIKENGQKLNSGMGKLKEGIGDKDGRKGRVNLSDGDEGKQQGYNTGVRNAENII